MSSAMLWPWDDGIDGWVATEHSKGLANAEALRRNTISFHCAVSAFFHFINQPIVATQRTGLTRAWRRRAGTGGSPAFINLVTLRSPVTQPKTGNGTREVDWSCRWIVRSHWRNQFYPGEKRHNPKWIPAYVKGPDDKPLRRTINLFNVSR
jgi:hypothetical protein